jgi:hypothetical protein
MGVYFSNACLGYDDESTAAKRAAEETAGGGSFKVFACVGLSSSISLSLASLARGTCFQAVRLKGSIQN